MRLLLAPFLFSITFSQQPTVLENALSVAKKGNFQQAREILIADVRNPDFRNRAVLHQMAHHFHIGSLSDELGDFHVAEHEFHMAESLCKTGQLGLECSLVVWNALTALYLEFGQTGQAERVLRKASNSKPETLGANHRELLRYWGNLAALEYVKNNPAQAIKWIRRAIDGWTAIGQKNSVEAAIARNILGLSYLNIGDTESAVYWLDLARRNLLELPEAHHFKLPKALSNLALAKAAAGDYAAAEELHQEAIQKAESMLGPNHPITARVMLNGSDFYASRKNKAEARQLKKRAEQVLSGYARDQGLNQTVDASSFH